jgi:hypothetical protein
MAAAARASASASRRRVASERLAAPVAYSAARTASRRISNVRPFEVTLTVLRRRSLESSVRWASPSFTSRSIIWLTEGSEIFKIAARLDGVLSGFLSAKFRRITWGTVTDAFAMRVSTRPRECEILLMEASISAPSSLSPFMRRVARSSGAMNGEFRRRYRD